VAIPVALTLAAIAAGWLLATAAGRSVPAGILGVAAAEGVLLAGLAILRRNLLRETANLVLGGVRSVAATGARTPTT
jgi:hypothetical protein